MNYELVPWNELPSNMIEKYNISYKTATAIIPLVKGNKFSVYAKACYNTREKDLLDWIEFEYKTEKDNLEFADEIGDFGWLKYYSSEYKRGYRLSRKVYIK